jgi:hypothetical protein
MPACVNWACLSVYWAYLPVYYFACCCVLDLPACVLGLPACVLGMPAVYWACLLCTGHACLCTGHATCVLGMPSVYLTCLPACLRGCLPCIASLLGETCISTFQSLPTSFCKYFSWTEFTVSSFFTVNWLKDILEPKIMLFTGTAVHFFAFMQCISHVPLFYKYLKPNPILVPVNEVR